MGRFLNHEGTTNTKGHEEKTEHGPACRQAGRTGGTDNEGLKECCASLRKTGKGNADFYDHYDGL